jgi:hypothetical protein
MALLRSSSSSEEFPLALGRALVRAGLVWRLRWWSSLDRDLDLDRVLDLDRDLDLDLESLLLDTDLELDLEFLRRGFELDDELDLEFLRRDFELDLDGDFLDLDLDFDLDLELFDDSDELELRLGLSLALCPLLAFLFFPFLFRLFLESSSDSPSDLLGDLLRDCRLGFFALSLVFAGDRDLLRGGVLSSRSLRSSVSFWGIAASTLGILGFNTS